MAVTLGVRSDLGQVALMPILWIKLAFPASLAVVGLVAAERLSPGHAPGGRLGRAGGAGAVGVVSGHLGIRQCGIRPASGTRLWQYLGFLPIQHRHAFTTCFYRRFLGDERAGTDASGTRWCRGRFHCPEMAAPFLGIWYVAGMAIPALAGALLGPRLLRW
jgi:hypothetical protein